MLTKVIRLPYFSLYFFTLCLVISLASAQNTTFYPQYTGFDVPANLLPTERTGAACTRAFVNVSSFALQENLLNNASGLIDSIICFGGYSRQYIPDGQQLPDTGGYVIGGVWHTFMLNDINLFSVADEQWYALNYDNATVRKFNEGYFENGHPNGRGHSSIVIYDNKMIVFGGWTAQTFLDSTVLIYDFDRNNWTRIEYNVTAGEAPRARYGHTATVYNDKMYIFGGYWPIPKFPVYNFPGNVTTFPPDFFNDVWELDLQTYTWTQLPVSGAKPSARVGHTSVLKGSSFYVFGGNGYSFCAFNFSVPRNECLTFTYFNDLWAFDLISQTWSLINTAGTPPWGREFHSAALNADETYMLIFGGRGSDYLNDIHKYFFSSNTWVTVGTSYPAAEPRYGHYVSPLLPGQKNLSSDLFILTFGRSYLSMDLATYGELYAGPLLEITPPPIDVETSTDTVVLSFDRKSPVQKLTPIDQCGDRVESSAVTITFASLTEVSNYAQVVQQVNFQKAAYELNTTFASQNPNFNFGLNSSAGLQLALDFQLFGVQTLLTYANETFLVDKSINKWSFEISGWRFLDTSNFLQIDVILSLPGGVLFDRQVTATTLSASRVRYTFHTESISFSVVISSLAELEKFDPSTGTTTKSIVSIQHKVNNDASPSILFTFPYFDNNTVLRYDPDFGVTINADAQPDSSCGEFEGWKIAVIVVCTVIPLSLSCLAVILVVVVYFYKRMRRPINEEEMVAFEHGDSSASTEDFGPSNSSSVDMEDPQSSDSDM